MRYIISISSFNRNDRNNDYEWPKHFTLYHLSTLRHRCTVAPPRSYPRGIFKPRSMERLHFFRLYRETSLFYFVICFVVIRCGRRLLDLVSLGVTLNAIMFGLFSCVVNRTATSNQRNATYLREFRGSMNVRGFPLKWRWSWRRSSVFFFVFSVFLPIEKTALKIDYTWRSRSIGVHISVMHHAFRFVHTPNYSQQPLGFSFAKIVSTSLSFWFGCFSMSQHVRFTLYECSCTNYRRVHFLGHKLRWQFSWNSWNAMTALNNAKINNHRTFSIGL